MAGWIARHAYGFYKSVVLGLTDKIFFDNINEDYQGDLAKW